MGFSRVLTWPLEGHSLGMWQSGFEVTCYLRDLHKAFSLQQADFHLKWHQILSCNFLFKGQWHPAKKRSQGWRSLSHGSVPSIPAATIIIPWRGGSKLSFGWRTAPGSVVFSGTKFVAAGLCFAQRIQSWIIKHAVWASLEPYSYNTEFSLQEILCSEQAWTRSTWKSYLTSTFAGPRHQNLFQCKALLFLHFLSMKSIHRGDLY